MTAKVFTVAAFKIAKADLDLDVANLWVALVMTNTTADTEDATITTMSNFTTLDECNGANYVRKKLASLAVARDDTNHWITLDAADVTWSALGNGTRNVQAALIYVDADDDGDPADDANNTPVALLDFSATQAPGGSDFQVQWNTTGLIKLAV